MMKYVFVLALLHLCVSARSDTNLNQEIIRRLNLLIIKVKPTNVTVEAPKGKTLKTPRECLGVIQKELENLLDNVTVDHKDEHYILELKGNLNALGKHKVNDECNMKPKQGVKSALVQYKTFFKRLNTRA